MPHLQNRYRTDTVINTASSSFGDAVVEVIDNIIDLAPLPQIARTALHAVTHTVARAAGSSGDFSSVNLFIFDKPEDVYR